MTAIFHHKIDITGDITQFISTTINIVHRDWIINFGDSLSMLFNHPFVNEAVSCTRVKEHNSVEHHPRVNGLET